MPNDKHLPLCPFYKRHMERSITCEDINRTFSDTAEKETWLRTYCDTTSWETCEYAKDLNEAYEKLFKGEDKAIMENNTKALEKEVKKLSTLLGKAEKRVERQQKKIDELRAVNNSFVSKNEELLKENGKLDTMTKDIYQKWRDVNERMEKYEETIANQVQTIADAYEVRLAYMIDRFGTFSDIDVDEWRKDKSFALVYDEDDDGYPCWNVRFEEGEKADGLQDSDIQTEEQK